MTFESRETSLLTGEPVDLYEFRKGVEVYRFTSSDKEITYQGGLYSPANLSRGTVRQGTSMVQGIVKVKATIDNAAAQWFVQRIPTEEATLKLITTHRISGTTTAEEPGAVLTFGRLSPPIRDRDKITFDALPYQGLLKAMVMRPTYQPVCNHTIYDDFCALVAVDYEDTATIASINGKVLTLSGNPARPDNYYKAGFVDVGGDFATVVNSSGGTITLFDLLPEAVGGDSIKLYPGCSGQHTICNTSFSNMERNLSFFMVPNISPFNGNSLRGNT